jgi:sulfotransferase
MVKKIFFNASLPRAGSTLLQNILMQNPEIYSTPTSGVVDLLLNARTLTSNSDAFKAQNQNEMESGLKGFCRDGLYGFFNSVTDRPYVFDKSRGWIGNYNFLEWFHPNSKIICMVRDLRSIFSSMEKNYRKNPQKDPLIVNAAELKNMTTTSRIDHFSVSPPIGPTIEWLFESIHQGYSEKVLFIKFEDFSVDPDRQMRRVYNYLDIPYYKHNFDNVEQLTHENDVIHGIFGDHIIRNKVEPYKEDFRDILGVTNSDRLYEHYNWFFKTFNYIK